MLNKIKVLVFYSFIFILLLTGALSLGHESKDESIVQFSKCTDGDTAHFIIEGRDETVRFLAIDTPETVKPGTPVQPYGKEASDYTCSAIKNAEDIRLEFEYGNEKDKYDRMLAWVFVDDVLLQEELIKQGYAKVDYLYGDYKYTDRLLDAEAKAKQQLLGIWSQ